MVLSMPRLLQYLVCMEIQLKPEIKQLIQQYVDSGKYKSVEHFVEEAILTLHYSLELERELRAGQIAQH